MLRGRIGPVDKVREAHGKVREAHGKLREAHNQVYSRVQF
jgi:hypothetical protein